MANEVIKGNNGIPQPIRRVLQRTVLELRSALEDDFRRQLTALGIRDSGIQPLPAGRTPSPADQRVRDAAIAVIERETRGGSSYSEALEFYVRESAFTFLNRVVGLRCLEERKLLLVDGLPEQAIRQDPSRAASSLYWRVRNELPAATNPREVWRETLCRAWTALSERIKVLFDPDSELAALLPLLPTLNRIVDALNSPETPPDTYAQDEFLGWVYQYYNSREKDEVYNRLGKGSKLERPDEIAAATCLYTERYMVDYLLQNTLGAVWVHLHPDSELPSNWPYFVKAPSVENAGNGNRVPEGGLEETQEDGLGSGRPRLQTPGSPRRLRDVTLLDPACGSGHFLVRAFDLLVQMYREEGIEPEAEIPHLILERNLHGIDIDPRSVQIAGLALYLKGCSIAGPDFRPRCLNLIAADALLAGDAPLPQYMARFQGDREIEDLVKGIWQGLKNVREYGSLLHPERAVDEVVKRRRQREKGSYWEADDVHWEQWKRDLLSGLREEFERESQSEDLGQRLFGQEAAKGVGLVEALGRRYDVVVANPPYADTRNLGLGLRAFLDQHYLAGKRDLYAAFFLRCTEFCRTSGYVGMVTQQAWMFLRSFAGLREHVLRHTSIGTLAHLGPNAFSEIGGEVVKSALITVRCVRPIEPWQFSAFRLVGPRSGEAKEALLRQAIRGLAPLVLSTPRQSDFQEIPESPLVYWLRPRFFDLLRSSRRLREIAEVRQGLATSDNDRFTRCFWEVTDLGNVNHQRPICGRWFPYAKGGRYQKWAGLEWLVLDWAHKGRAVRDWPESVVRNEAYYFRSGLTYTLMAQGSIGLRVMDGSVFDVTGMSVFPFDSRMLTATAALGSTHLASYLLRVTTQDLKFNGGYVSNLPIPEEPLQQLASIASECIRLKQWLVAQDPLERSFMGLPSERSHLFRDLLLSNEDFDGTGVLAWCQRTMTLVLAVQTILHALEGVNEQVVSEAYNLEPGDVRAVLDETGVPAGWHPLIAHADSVEFPSSRLLANARLEMRLQSHRRLVKTVGELAELRDRLRSLYSAGHGAKVEDPVDDTEEGGAALGAYIPVPVETFLEDLSQKLEIHPISVYWLLKEMREQEGLACPPELKRHMEDYASVSIIRMLGYRWPEQDKYEAEHGPILDPEMVDGDGIIPLVPCGGEPTAEERVRMRLERDFGEEGAERSLKEFRQWVGRDLGDWLHREFFKRHVQQFKQRPIAWHLVSPGRTFEAFVLYHKLSRETLQKLRAQYAGSLIERLRSDQERARARGESNKVTELQLQIEDVEEFRSRIEKIERGDELKYRIRCRWKGEEATGRPGPYAPDIDDGVKVNIRPFQEAGLLAVKQVIKKW